MVGGTKEAVARGRARLRDPRPRGRLRPRGSGGGRPLREDGPQRDRVRPHAGLRRGLRDHAVGRGVLARPARDRLDLALRLGGAQLAARADGAGHPTRGQFRRDRPGHRRLGRGPLDVARGHRPGRAGAGHHRRPLQPLHLAATRTPTPTSWWPPCGTSSAATPSPWRAGSREWRPRRRWANERRLPASADPPARPGHLRGLGRPGLAQDPAGPGQPGRAGPAERQLHGDRGGPHPVDRRGVPTDGDQVRPGPRSPLGGHGGAVPLRPRRVRRHRDLRPPEGPPGRGRP